MHLAIVTPFPPTITGVSHYAQHLVRAIAETGEFKRITILTERPPGKPATEQEATYRIERIWLRNGPGVTWHIVRRLISLKPDVIWFNLSGGAFGTSLLSNATGLLCPTLVRPYGIPTLVTLHEFPSQVNLEALGAPGGPIRDWIADRLTSAATRADVVCVTLQSQATWLATHQTRSRVLHIPHGTFAPPRILPPIDGKELLGFSLGAPYKGLDVMLDAFAELQTDIPDLRLTIAGADHPRYPGFYESARQRFATHPSIRWLGFVPEDLIPDLFARATIVVLPWRATTGSSSVLYRAVTWGRPIVASDLPELRAAADEEGFRVNFFPNGQPTALATTIRQLLRDPASQVADADHNAAIAHRLTLTTTRDAYLQALRIAMMSRIGSREP